MNLFEEKELKKLNGIANYIISTEMKYPLDTDLLLYVFKKMYKEPSIGKKTEINVQLGREKLLKDILIFLKNIDIEYYSEALDFIIQLKKNRSLEIFHSKKSNLSRVERDAVKLMGMQMFNYKHDYIQLLIPTGLDETREEYNNNIENKASLKESFSMLHEIAHSFDFDAKKAKEILSKTINIDEKSYKKALKDIMDSSIVRDAFCETTAITFERLYSEYLMNNEKNNTVINRAINRYNDCLLCAEICYDNLSIADIKRKKGIIKNEDLELLMKEDNNNERQIRYRISRIFKYNGNIRERKRYAVAGLFAPALVEQYKQRGPEVLKQYINSIKNNSVDEIFETIQISQSKEGYDKLLNNMKSEMKLVYDVGEKKNMELEK